MNPDIKPRTVGHYFGRLPEDLVDRLRRPRSEDPSEP
jgi:hypothetical protein